MQKYAAFQAVVDRGGSSFSRLIEDDNENAIDADTLAVHEDGGPVERMDSNNFDHDEGAFLSETKHGSATGGQLLPTASNYDDNKDAEYRAHARANHMHQLSMHPSNLGIPLQSVDQLTTEQLEAERNRIIETARKGYEHAMEHFSSSELMAIMAATFYRYLFPFHYQECTCLAHALRRGTNLDSSFYIYSRLRHLNESDGSGLGPIERILFDQERKSSSSLRVDAYRLLQQLWGVLADSTPDLLAVQEVGVQLLDTLNRIESSFDRLLHLNPQSTKTLRAYA